VREVLKKGDRPEDNCGARILESRQQGIDGGLRLDRGEVFQALHSRAPVLVLESGHGDALCVIGVSHRSDADQHAANPRVLVLEALLVDPAVHLRVEQGQGFNRVGAQDDVLGLDPLPQLFLRTDIAHTTESAGGCRANVVL